MKKFDVIVIGTGSGAYVARKCAEAGKKTCIIDNLPFGGTCALRGCIPKKILTGIANVLFLNEQLQRHGIKNSSSGSWKDLMKFKKTFTDPVPQKRETALEKVGIVTYNGRAHFLSDNTLQVNDDILYADKFVIAVGSKPARLSIPGEEFLSDSTDFLQMKELPGKLIFIGGGFIAFEFAFIAASFGAKVIILQRGNRPLKNFDTDIVKHLVKAAESRGIKVVLNTEVKSILKRSSDILIKADSGGKELRFTGQIAVHAAGRSPDIEDLGLEKINVATGKKGIKVNKYMQSVTNPDVYSCGDANDSGLPLTPVGSMEAVNLVENLLNGNNTEIEYGNIPSNVFSIPPLAKVGLTEDEAKKKKLKFVTVYKDTTGWYSSKRLNEKVSAFKILIEKKTDLILGAHLLGYNADEIINIFALAMNNGIKAGELRKTIFTYPTNASDISSMLKVN